MGLLASCCASCNDASHAERRVETTSCRRLAPTVDALASDFDGRATVAKLNVDENPSVPGRYAIRGIPTLLLFKEGQLAETIVGLAAKEDIARMIERHLA